MASEVSPMPQEHEPPASPTALAPESEPAPLEVTTASGSIGNVVLDVRNLRTYFFTYDGVVKALDGVTFNVRRGETVGLVGETGCGKSVTAFSITKLVADPPGRIMDGTILFKGSNLLWGLDKEARFKTSKNSKEIKVLRKYRRIKAGQERMNAVRGAGISMIFQEPTSAMNPIFSINDQISEALLLHKGPAIVESLLNASPDAPRVMKAIGDLVAAGTGGNREAVAKAASVLRRIVDLADVESKVAALAVRTDASPSVRQRLIFEAVLSARAAQEKAAIENAIQVTRANDPKSLRAACDQLAGAARLASVGTEAFYILRGSWSNPERKRPDLEDAVKRTRLSPFQKRYLVREQKRLALHQELKAVYLAEMRFGRLESAKKRAIARRRIALRFSGAYFGLWGVRNRVRHPLGEECFWETVKLLEGVTIANPVQVARGFPHELSGGMLQRVMIAMALSAEPELLIADEPTTALDVTIQAQILELMRDLKQRVGTAVMLITHDLGVIAEVADRVCVMYAGNIVEIGAVREIFKQPLHPYTQGLLASIPRMDDPTKRLESIPGSVPNLIYPPTGCRFHPRCPQAMPVCKDVRPPMTVEGAGHVVACHLYHGPVAKG
ncbi:MAG TPA: oligopeptide/dipeptide ABC transporter ATP-binding protein [Thermoplasmata archaeon]|nr:oligopeptide/dipeptide ABC transporter ATP-binding protein [Thermoplasmata archaeon]